MLISTIPNLYEFLCDAVSMEWDTNENQIDVIALFKCNKSPLEIFNLLKPLKMTQKFVYLPIKRFNEMKCVKAKGGHLE